jgi:hypothetical protein
MRTLGGHLGVLLKSLLSSSSGGPTPICPVCQAVVRNGFVVDDLEVPSDGPEEVILLCLHCATPLARTEAGLVALTEEELRAFSSDARRVLEKLRERIRAGLADGSVPLSQAEQRRRSLS